MSPAKPLLAACAAVALGYLAWPYLTLYRLDTALYRGDARTLHALVNWPAVREGIKEDIADSPSDTHDLPGFGASFVRGVATRAVERQVTPEALVAAVHTPAPADGHAGMRVNWAFFDGPTRFSVVLTAPGQAAPIRLQLRLRDAGWQVTRVWLPSALLDRANRQTAAG